MRNSALGEGHIKSATVVPAGVQPIVGRRSLAVMLGGLSALGPLSIDAYLPAFADIQRDFQASTADLQLTLTSYLLAFACMSLMHGPLSDAFGRRRVILSEPAGIRVGGARMCAFAQRRLAYRIPRHARYVGRSWHRGGTRHYSRLL